jgi:rubrerythrin
MNQNYSSRKRKIYNDYSSVPYERLIEIVKNSKDYNRDVIEVIKDILRERGASIPNEVNKDYAFTPSASSYQQDNNYKPENSSMGIGSLAEKLRAKEPEEIISTITRYSEFLPEAVQAALIVAVDKGLISFDLRNSLSEQITSNRSRHWDRDGRYEWEKNNAFIELVKGYSDDDIYRIIEEPSGIVIDVYHAVLVTALKRELISAPDFTNYFENAKKALRGDDEIEDDEFKDLIKETPLERLFDDKIDLESEKEKFWKCPKCGEAVLMDITVCWNCETTMPVNIVHPSTEEITKELIEESKPGIRTYLLIGLGFVLMIGGVILRGYIRGRSFTESLLIFLIIMVIVILYTVIFKKKR